MLTQSRLKELLHYCPDTGIFTRIRKSYHSSNKPVGTHFKGYRRTKLDGKSYLVHRLVWLYVHGYFPEFIDHINHTRDDNRLCNLREATKTDNQRNIGMQSNNTSGHMGVSWNKRKNKWYAHISHNSKQKSLGYFHSIEDAVHARKEAEARYKYHKNHGS